MSHTWKGTKGLFLKGKRKINSNWIMKKIYYSLGMFVIFIGLFLSCMEEGFWDSIIPETDEETTQSQINGYVFKPALVPASDERVQRLDVPDGFSVEKFAENLGKPRILVASS